ncbi:oligomeric Golgi complex subunit 7 [Mucidula mucida]|nr:oligomeric Golgi complex subunit 7 [Mucidula mucida]
MSELDSLNEYDDIIAWVNDILPDDEASTGLTVLDKKILELLGALDAASDDTSSQLERTIDDVSRGVPRLAYDLHFMKDGAVTLQNLLAQVHVRSKAAIPDSTRQALAQLHVLDNMKRHMEAARDVLREAESWSTLEMEVTSLLSDRQYAKAAARLSEASRSMVVFQNTPEYDPRRTLMISLQNQLEASLSSALVAAINVQDLAACKSYFSIFSDIQRESEFRNYYNGSRRASLMTLWQSTKLTDCDENGTQTFLDFLRTFNAECLSLLNHERSVMPSIFPDPAISLSALVTSILAGLQPSFPHRLASVSSYYGDSSLKMLISLFKETEDFASSVQKIIEKMKYSATVSEDAPPPSPSRSRRRSMRMSMSFRPGPARASSSSQSVAKTLSLYEWEQELFQPFLDFQVDYASLERRFLDNSLISVISLDGNRQRDADSARLLRERSVDAFGAAEESTMRCLSFTHGYATVGLVQALDSFFKSFMDTWSREIRTQLETSSSAVSNDPSEDELSALDYTTGDWAAFQLSLHLLTSARSFHERLLSFESKLRANIAQISTSFRLARDDPSTFSTSASRRHLEQSILNSAELHSLLEPTRSGHNDAIITEARTAVFEFARVCQQSLQRIILSPLIKSLDGYGSLPVWTSMEEKGQAKYNDLHVPTFSLDPSEHVKRVAEGLSNLPRLFEGYVDDDALSFSLDTLPHIQSPVGEPHGHSRRLSVSSVIKPLDRDAVSSAWLSSFGQTFLVHLTKEVLPTIQELSGPGAAQLAVDLGYISHNVDALNVELEDLNRWRLCVEAEDLDAVQVKDDIWREVARMRKK